MWSKSILDTIGNTPLVELHKLSVGLPCTLLAKVEFFNPGGSVKDRIGISMIEDGERRGLIKPGGTIIEATSGNTGAGLAIAAIVKGYKCIFTLNDKQSQEKIDVLRAFGAEVIVCPTNVEADDPRSYYSVARRLANEIPNSYYPDQYDNPSNNEAHYWTSGPELWEQTEGKITHYFCGGGTAGTLCGTAKFLKEQNPAVKIIGIDPYGSVYHKMFHDGIADPDQVYPYIVEGVGKDIPAKNMDMRLVDDYVQVNDYDTMNYTRRLTREEGIFAGGSCGMAIAGALQWLHAHKDTLKPTDVAVVLLPDSGFRYLSKVYNDQWMRDYGFLSQSTKLTAGDVAQSGQGLVRIEAEQSVPEAVQLLTQAEISQAPVVENGKFVGSISERKLLSLMIQDAEVKHKKVRDVMGAPFPIASKFTQIEQLSRFFDLDHDAVLIHNHDDQYDIITRSDVIRALAQST